MKKSMVVLVATALLSAVALAACDGGSMTTDTPAPTSESSTPNQTISTGDWTMLGHDLTSSFHNESESRIDKDNAGHLVEAWRFTAPASVTGTPAVVDDTVYVLSSGGTFALDVTTGTELWRNPSIGGTSSPTYRDGVLYVTDFGARLHALDAATGEELWQAPIDSHERAAGFSSPVVVGDLVIVGSSSTEEAVATENATFRGGMVAFDRETGAEVWRHYAVEPPFNGVAIWSSASVDLDAGLVFGTTGNNYTGEASDTSDAVFALDLETGELVWNTQLTEGDVFTILRPQSDDTDFGTNAILFEATIDGESRRLVGAGQKSGMFWALDRDTGEIVWSRQVSGGSALIGGVFNNGAYDGERIIVAGNGGTSDGPGSEPANGESEFAASGVTTGTSVLMAMDPATGDVLWERQLPAWVWAPITIANGVGFVSAETTLQAFDVATGDKLFEFQTGGTIASGAAVAGGRVFFGSGLAYFTTTPGNTLHALELP